MKKSLYLMLFVLPLAITPVYANDHDDDSGVFFKNLLTKAGIVGEKKELKYQERPPLVLPPSVTGKAAPSALPAPSQSAAEQSKNWPTDPDALKAKKDAERVKKPANVHYNASRTLTPEELNHGRVAGASVPTISTEKNVYNPTAGTGSLFNVKKDEDKRIEFKGEAPRTSLIQPPPGYKTPSANQPFGPVGKTDYSVLEIDPKTGKPK